MGFRKKKPEFDAKRVGRAFNTAIKNLVNKIQGNSKHTYYQLSQVFGLKGFIYSQEFKDKMLKITFKYDADSCKLSRAEKKARVFICLNAIELPHYGTGPGSGWIRIDPEAPVISVEINKYAPAIDLLTAILISLRSRLGEIQTSSTGAYTGNLYRK